MLKINFHNDLTFPLILLSQNCSGIFHSVSLQSSGMLLSFREFLFGKLLGKVVGGIRVEAYFGGGYDALNVSRVEVCLRHHTVVPHGVCACVCVSVSQ